MRRVCAPYLYPLFPPDQCTFSYWLAQRCCSIRFPCRVQNIWFTDRLNGTTEDACFAYREIQHPSTAATAHSAWHVCVLYGRSLPVVVLGVMGVPRPQRSSEAVVGLSLEYHPMGLRNVSFLASLQLCEQLFLLKSCTSQGQGARALPQKLSQESVAFSHSGLYQNSKISLCITPSFIRNLAKKLNNLTNPEEFRLSKIRPHSWGTSWELHSFSSPSLYIMQAFWGGL